ncbi:MAG: hypothetical protein ACP5XB_22270 [Isosphaeraceae bacterium]
MILHCGKKAAERPARRGSLLVELALSAAMLMIAMGLTVKVLGWVGVQRRNWERRQIAVQEAANVMERLTARPFESVTPESTRDIPLSARARQSLPGVELKVDVRENDRAGGAGSKRVAIALRWQGRSGEWDAPVHLTSWIYRGRPDR